MNGTQRPVRRSRSESIHAYAAIGNELSLSYYFGLGNWGDGGVGSGGDGEMGKTEAMNGHGITGKNYGGGCTASGECACYSIASLSAEFIEVLRGRLKAGILGLNLATRREAPHSTPEG